MCVCMCVYVNIQTHVSSVDIARINALATTICCFFFFQKEPHVQQKATHDVSLLRVQFI